MNPTEITKRLAALEAQAQYDRERLTKSERKLRVTWAVSALAAALMLSIGWHKDAIAQGYGMTLAQAATRIAALETKTGSMTAITDPNTNVATVRFTGVNVQIVNGNGGTNSLNGTGNLIIGYNETRASFGGNGDARSGSHNLIVGLAHSYSGNSGAVIGIQSTISGRGASVLGGIGNTASGSNAAVLGGYLNTASGSYSCVSGGIANGASGQYSSVSGGFQHGAPDTYNWVGGSYTSAQ